MTEFRRVALRTGVTLSVALAGAPSNAPVVLLHGFPESHRTWREIAPRLADEFYLIMPDQRGFAGSDRPQDVEAYATDVLVDDIFALADALGVDRFALVGHDWGGAIAWTAALKEPERLTRLAIINAPHPLIFQKSLIESSEQRAASQYISAFRSRMFEKAVDAMGYDALFEKSFSRHVDLAIVPQAERDRYIAEWSEPGGLTAMLNWYRASKLIVPPPGITIPLPDWMLRPFPKIRIPTRVIWGMKDVALLPVQLEDLDHLVEDLSIVRVPDAGHFVPWEAPDDVFAALQPFLAADVKASAGEA